MATSKTNDGDAVKLAANSLYGKDNTKHPIFGADAVVLDELQIVDKATLIGKPFIIRTVMVSVSLRQVEYMDVDIEFEDGTTATFKDSSSTGVKHQVTGYLDGLGVELTYGVFHDLAKPIFCPEGLRVSEYEVQERGKTKTARTYYLTTSGKRKR